MITVRDIINKQQTQVHTIEPGTTVQAAIQIMSSEKISALPVVENGKLVGIISERDYVRKIASQKIPAWSVKINEIMTSEVITVNFDVPIEDCMELMTTNRIRHLPVMHAGKLVAMMSITDVLTALHSSEFI